MADLAAWELISRHLNAPDICTVFIMRRSHRTLRERESLWRTLRKRDFPEHVNLCPAQENGIWYRDLYQYGAYFGLRRAVNLYPEKVLFTCFQPKGWRRQRESSFDFGVLTSRVKTGFTRCWQRFPGQLDVSLVNPSELESEEHEALLKMPQSSASALRDPSLYNLLFVRLPTGTNHKFKTFPLTRYDDSAYIPIVDWLHRHFFIALIDQQGGCITFFGKLRPGYELSCLQTNNRSDPEMKEWTAAIRHTTFKCTLSSSRLGVPFFVGCVDYQYNDKHPHDFRSFDFNQINGKGLKIPCPPELLSRFPDVDDQPRENEDTLTLIPNSDWFQQKE